MKIIDESFNKIKEASGIHDLDEIANTFIKSEEQNYALYNYVDMLTQEIDQIKDENASLQDDIQHQKSEIEEKMRRLSMTPQDKVQENQMIAQMREREKMIQDLQETLTAIQPGFHEMLITLSSAPFAKKYEKANFFRNQEDFQLNENNIEYFLGELEELLNMFFEARFNLTEQVNPYVTIVEEQKEQNLQQKEKNRTINAVLLEEANYNQNNGEMLDQSKFHDFAQEVVEKKKNNSNASQGVKKYK